MRHRTADLEPTSFGGRYTLIRKLAVGGMAEIYLAKQAAMAGFEKEVVIKRLRAELADDPRIVEMFLDEARIGALLNHPNIVHVYDVDEQSAIPYIAMEYIVGEELNELCRRGIAHGRFLPLEHAVELMRQAAAGLGYFHAKRGTEGTALADQPLEIVHLDISPSNLLVTQDGFLKVIDFGIARARGQRQLGDVIPGKLSYMSPEQAVREHVDHRSDIFSLGIVLYEITVGKRLFRGGAQEVVEKLVSAQVPPPTFVRRNFPPALEAIVMRALEKHPAERYQSAYDLADDLESFLRDEKLHSGPVRIARYLDMLAHAGGGKRRPELVSEAEQGHAKAAARDELDFDSQTFDSFAPREGAPGPEQAREWEDADQPEADVAAALGIELAELRQLRTPVPTRRPEAPGELGMPAGDDEDDDFGGVTKIKPQVAATTPAGGRLAVGTKSGEGDSADVDMDDGDDDSSTLVAQPPKPVAVRAATLAPAVAGARPKTSSSPPAIDPAAAAAAADLLRPKSPSQPPDRPSREVTTPGDLPAGMQARTKAISAAPPERPSRAVTSPGDLIAATRKAEAEAQMAQLASQPRPMPMPLTAVSPAMSPAALPNAPGFGAAYLARATSRTPWILAAVLGVALLALVAYIVLK